MSCVKEFRNNSELSKQAKTFGQFFDYRSNFDKGYLEKYDNLALKAPTGPNPGLVKEHYCSSCGQPKKALWRRRRV